MRRCWVAGEYAEPDPEGASLIPCVWCKRKSPLKVWRIRKRDSSYDDNWKPRPRPVVLNLAHVECAARDECRRYRDRKEEKARARRELRSPPAPNSGSPGCPWCGEPVLLDQSREGWKRRRARGIHRADGWEINAPDHGGPSCLQLLNWWRNPRSALRHLNEQQGGRCACCGEQGVKMEVDHIKPIWDGGTNALENLQALSATCHKEKTREEARERRRRRREAAKEG